MIAAHNRGTINITTEKLNDLMRITISDDGPGISPENLGRIFDPFYTTKEVGKGTGLGLSICHGIVIEHGGYMYAKSEPGKGASFIIEFPLEKS
jgi:two-component system, NtrC family, sensor kinase